MRTRLLAVLASLVVVAALAAPEATRSGKSWGIYLQQTEDDWQSLIAGTNLAAGKPVTFFPAPNYQLAVDAGDAAQLTDGALAAPAREIMTRKPAVAWNYTDRVRWLLDLGQSQPLDRVVFRLQVLNEQSSLPKTISVALSDDGDSFVPVKDLSLKASPEDNPELVYEPMPGDKAVYAVSLSLGTQARYVRLDFATPSLLASDELAVIAATGKVEPLPAAPAGKREYEDNVFDRRDQFKKLTAPGNLLLGLPLKYAPQPGYRLTSGESDPADLTNGQLGERTNERIWFEQGAVTWQHNNTVTIMADLGSVQPVDYLVARFLGGGEQGGLLFPDEFRVLASDNGTDFYQVSDRHKRGLDDLSENAYDLPEVKVAWVHNFVLPVKLKTRYLALQVTQLKQFISTDEIAAVKGPDTLPEFRPDPARKVILTTSGVAFTGIVGNLPVCQNLPLRAKFMDVDARSGKDYGGPCKMLLDVPETLKFITEGYTPAEVEHGGRKFQRYAIDCNRGKITDFYLQSLLPAGKTDVLYTYGDTGSGPENERAITWESIYIPKARLPKRLNVTLAWIGTEGMVKTWPDYFNAIKHLGFNGVGFMPRYWSEAGVEENKAIARATREAGLKIVQNESPSSAVGSDRNQPEVKSQLVNGELGDYCPSYRGQYYQKEHQGFAQHAVWLQPDYIYYDIEAFWHGAREAPRCTRCQERFKAGGFTDWDAFCAAMGKEMHADMKADIDKALAAAGIEQKIIYGSYRTDAITPLNDGLFNLSDLYPELLQMAMPSLYVAGNAQAVATNISRNRAALTTNDIVPWFSTGTYGEYEPVKTRDMILEGFANGANGLTYYYYGNFDAGHFKYHAEAVDIVAPIEDIFMDGKPLTGLKADNEKIKVCGMGAGPEMAVLISNYSGVPTGMKITVQTPAKAGTPVWDLHSGKQIGKVGQNGSLSVTLDDIAAHMYYLGSKYNPARQ